MLLTSPTKKMHTVPIPEAMAYLMLRPLLSDVADDDMCGVTVDKVFPATEKWHPLLLQAVSGIPERSKAGDSVWWHADMIHGVDPVTDQKGWGNVMYIPAAPWCPRNQTYAATVREAFRTGSSPSRLPRRALRAELGRPLPGRRPQHDRTPRPRPRLRGDPGAARRSDPSPTRWTPATSASTTAASSGSGKPISTDAPCSCRADLIGRDDCSSTCRCHRQDQRSG